MYHKLADVIDLVDYNKTVGFLTIKRLAAERQIDTVYVRFADEPRDRMYDCWKPSDMKELRDIIAGHYRNVVGWRLHNHKREEKNIAAAKAIMKGN